MARLLLILAAISAFSPLFGWEVRLYGVRPGATLPQSGSVPQSFFDSVRSESPIAIFKIREGESAGYRLYDPAVSYRVSITPRETAGISFKLSLTDFRSTPAVVGSATVNHADEYIYLLRPLGDQPILVQLSP